MYVCMYVYIYIYIYIYMHIYIYTYNIYIVSFYSFKGWPHGSDQTGLSCGLSDQFICFFSLLCYDQMYTQQVGGTQEEE